MPQNAAVSPVTRPFPASTVLGRRIPAAISLLQRVADEQGLTRNVHPGYRTLSTQRASGPSRARAG
ncbi:MAG TPA: hypothetical protein VME68_00250 [Acidobacteriaceae bacterium]|nr:hypothetical protein [Acidobacteriaceae bacterium]